MKTILAAIKLVVATAGLLLVVGGLALGLYLYGQKDRPKLDSFLEKGRQQIEDARPLSDSAREAVSSIKSTFEERLTNLRATAPLEVTQGDIRVYFAPTAKLNPQGIDNRFLNFLDSASESIYGAIYDFELEDAAEILIAKHNEGVDVRLVSDTEYQDRTAIKKCIYAGIDVVFDERSAFMHNKFAIVDGKTVWTGSTNITSNGMFRNNNNALLIASPQLAQNYTQEFGELFRKKFGVRSPADTPYRELLVDDVKVECYFAPEDKVRREIIDELKDADRTVDFMAFSFTSDDIAKVLIKRMDKGVKVRGLFEKRNAGSKYSEDERLAEKGAQIYMDTNPYTMHHKVFIIDGDTVITGSYNFSESAEKKNDENVLILHSKDIAKQYTEEFESLIGAN